MGEPLWERRTVATWDEWRMGDHRCFKTNFYGPWHFGDASSIIFTDDTLQEVMAFANSYLARGVPPIPSGGETR